MRLLTESAVLVCVKSRNPEKMRPESLLNSGQLIIDFFHQYAASDPFGWDWPTMNAVFPELCARFREFKMHYKDKEGTLTFKNLVPITSFETLSMNGVPSGNVYRKYRDTTINQKGFHNSRKGLHGDGDLIHIAPNVPVRYLSPKIV